MLSGPREPVPLLKISSTVLFATAGWICHQIKNVPSVSSQDVSGSPPPGLPNYMVILCPVGQTVNGTYVTDNPPDSDLELSSISNVTFLIVENLPWRGRRKAEVRIHRTDTLCGLRPRGPWLCQP